MKTLFLITALSIGVLGVNLIGILWLAAKSGRQMDESIREDISDNSMRRHDVALARTEDQAITLDC